MELTLPIGPAGWPVAEWATQLTASFAALGETTALLRVSDAPVVDTRLGTTPDGVRVVTLASGASAQANLGAAVDRVHAEIGPARLVLDATRARPEVLGDLTRQVDRVVFFTPDTFAALPTTGRPGGAMIPVALVHGDGPARLHRAGATRVEEPASAFGDRWRRAELDAPARAAVDRVARAVLDRRVGLALGGGGAWGFAHVALLRELEAAGVPVDLIAGVSFGSVVGAFYCAEGAAGLDRLLANARQLRLAVLSGVVSTLSLDLFLRHHLGDRALERLPLPLFPVATNVETGEPEPLRHGRLAAAVRASGSLPGLLTPTLLNGVRYVDGAISGNVPAPLLSGECADLVIASDVVRRPAGVRAARPAPRTAAGRWASEFNPVRRAGDLVLSLITLTHNAGQLLTLNAHVTWQARPMPFAPWAFAQAHEIVAHAREDAAETVERVAAAYQALTRDRRAALASIERRRWAA